MVDSSFWARKGVASAAEYVIRNGLPSDPYAFFGVEPGIFSPGSNVSIVVADSSGRVTYRIAPPNPVFDKLYPNKKASLAWPRNTGDPLRDWNNALAMSDGKGFPDEYKWVDAGNPADDEQVKAWDKKYGSVFPTLAEYQRAVDAVKSSGGAITPDAVTEQVTNIIAARPPEVIAPQPLTPYSPPPGSGTGTIDAPVRPDPSLPTQGINDGRTGVPTASIIPVAVEKPLVQTEGSVTASGSPTPEPPNPAQAAVVLKWTLVAVAIVALIAVFRGRKGG